MFKKKNVRFMSRSSFCGSILSYEITENRIRFDVRLTMGCKDNWVVVEHRTFHFNCFVEFFVLFRKSFKGTHFHEHHELSMSIIDDHLD